MKAPRRFPLTAFIAWRYLTSRGNRSVVRTISWISLIGLAVSAMALIVVLSVYNGIGRITQELFNSFDPPLLAEPATGKTLRLSPETLGRLQQTEGVATVSQIVQENAWATCRDRQAIVTLRGVDTVYHLVTGLDTMLYQGTYTLGTQPAEDEIASLILGADIYYDLGASPHSNSPVYLHIPRREGPLATPSPDAFRTATTMPAGNFLIQQDIDRRYALTDIATARRLLDYDSLTCTALAISLAPKASANKTQQRVKEVLGPDCRVLNRFEQQPLYYKIFRSERLGIYIILALIVFISTLSLVASLSLLIMSKQRDAGILLAQGLGPRRMRRVFLAEGAMICAIAAAAGLAVGFVLCFVQQRFGIVRMGDGNFVVSAFPVAMRATDFVLTLLMVTLIGTSAVALTVRKQPANG
ncbi:MAG: FtsX-like permease family protein [Bacteroidales bacterium]|nr:FtsX-like permease family protein [Bacteroidales bacterium]